MTALMMGLIMVMTFIIRIPVPATQGYIHLGDCMIFLAVLVLGWKHGAIAAGVGSAMADLIGGYAIYAPVTLVVDFSRSGVTVMEIIGMCIGGIVMVAGYYVAEGIMYGNFITPMASVPMNILQFVVGAVIATALSRVLAPTPAGKSFAYNLSGHK